MEIVYSLSAYREQRKQTQARDEAPAGLGKLPAAIGELVPHPHDPWVLLEHNFGDMYLLPPLSNE